MRDPTLARHEEAKSRCTMLSQRICSHRSRVIIFPPFFTVSYTDFLDGERDHLRTRGSARKGASKSSGRLGRASRPQEHRVLLANVDGHVLMKWSSVGPSNWLLCRRFFAAPCAYLFPH